MAPRRMHPISYAGIKSFKLVSDDLNELRSDRQICAERIDKTIAEFLKTENLPNGDEEQIIERQIIGHVIACNSKQIRAAARLRSQNFLGQIYGDDRNPAVWRRIAAAAGNNNNLQVLPLRPRLAEFQLYQDMGDHLEVDLNSLKEALRN